MRKKFSNRRGPNPHLNSLQRVRAHLGLTQDDLAGLMNVSRQAVAMDERGDRALPWLKVARLHDLERVLPAADEPAPPPPAPPVLTADDREELDLRRQELALEAYRIKQKLKRCRVRLAQARLWQQVLPALRAAFPADDANAQEWLDLFEGRAASTLRLHSGTAARLDLRLAAGAFEVAAIERLLAEAGPAEAPPGG